MGSTGASALPQLTLYSEDVDKLGAREFSGTVMPW